MEKKARECIPISGVLPTNSYSKIDIREPGHYCLTEDLHARIEFGDRPAEGAMITIWTSNVVLDLQGHTLGRGRLFRNTGGVGISIERNKTNIVIQNGTLRDFERAIYRYENPSVEGQPIHDPHTNTYRFPIANITIENVTFKNNKKDMVIEVKKDMTP